MLLGGNISSSADIYAAGSVVAGGHITTAGDIDQIYTQGNQSHIYTMQANSHIMTMGGGNISSSADVYAAQDLRVGRNARVIGALRTTGDASHIYTKGENAHISTWGGGSIYTQQGGKILTTGGGEISSSGDIYSAGHINAEANIYSSNGSIHTAGGLIFTTNGHDIRTFGGGDIQTIPANGVSGGNISSSANVYALGNMVAGGEITGSGIHSSGDFSSGGNISTIGGGNISSSGDVYVDGGIAAQNQIISRNQFLVMDQPGVAAAMMGQGVFANNGYHIKTFGGGDISSSANVYAAQTIGVGKVADSGYAIDVANGLGDIRASAFVTYSDRSLKQNINPINNALEKVMKLEAVSYEMKGNQKQEIGFIAQDVAKIIPEICAIGDDGEGKGIDYSRLTSMLVGAIKAQQQQIEELKAIIKK